MTARSCEVGQTDLNGTRSTIKYITFKGLSVSDVKDP
jgi:hypothetical protein